MKKFVRVVISLILTATVFYSAYALPNHPEIVGPVISLGAAGALALAWFLIFERLLK
jgi:hypothetical protein